MAFGQSFAAARGRRIEQERLALAERTQRINLAKEGYRLGEGDELEVIEGSQAQLQQVQIQEQLELSNTLKNQLIAKDTDEALTSFTSSGDPNDLNRVLVNNPYMKEMFPDIQGIDNINFEKDKDLLVQNGFSEEVINDKSTWNTLGTNFFKYYDGNEFQIGSAQDIAAATGTFKRINSEKRKVMIDHLEQVKSAMTPTIEPDTKEELERLKLDLMKRGQSISLLAKRFSAKGSNVGKLQEDIDTGGRLIKELFSKTGGSFETFAKQDFEALRGTNEGTDIERLVMNISRADGRKIKPEDKKELRELRRLMSLAGGAGDIPDPTTGVFGTRFTKYKQFLSDNVTGIQERTALNLFISLYRKSLVGTQITDKEFENFEKIFAGSGKRGVVLEQLRAAMSPLSARLSSMKQILGPISSVFYLGADTKRLDNIITTLDSNIAKIKGIVKSKSDKIKKSRKQVKSKPKSILNTSLADALKGII